MNVLFKYQALFSWHQTQLLLIPIKLKPKMGPYSEPLRPTADADSFWQN